MPGVCGRWVAAGALACLVMEAGPARAAGAKRTHDNVYVHGGLHGGPAWLGYDAPMGTGVQHRGRATSPAFGLELAMGGTLPHGLVLGVMALVHVQSDPKFDNPRIAQGWDHTSSAFAAFVALARFYPIPTEGFHVEAFGGPASYRFKSEVEVRQNEALICPFIFRDCWKYYVNKKLSVAEEAPGYDLGGGAGYDWWVGSQVSLGFTGRFEYAHASKGARRYTVLFPSLSISASYH